MRRLRVFSNGELQGTRVVDAETGEDFSNSFTAARIEISAETGFVPRIWLQTFDVEIDLIGQEVDRPVESGP